MSLGGQEIFVILILALLLFGPDKLPELARQAARVIRDVRRAADEVKSQFNLLGDDDEDDEPRRPLSNMRDKINDNRDNDNRDNDNRDNDNRDVETRTEDYTEARDQTSSTRSVDTASNDTAHVFNADEIENDTFYINDADGYAPTDNNWDKRRSDAANAQNSGENSGESQSWAPKPLATSPLDSAPTLVQTSVEIASLTANDVAADNRAVNDLELRVTPSASVARASAPNRVRIEEDETTA